MKKRIFLFFVGVWGLFYFSNAFDTLPTDKQLAKKHIYQLRNGGALVVRLKARMKTINAYRASGDTAIANRIQQDDFKLNQKMVEAFTNQFRFCPVYFIYAYQTRDLLKNGSTVFLNKNLLPDSGIVFQHSYFLFVDYGNSLVNESVGSYNYSLKNTTEGSTPGSSQAYVILNRELRQLQAPFPYIVYLNPFDFNPHTKAIERLNKKLFSFYAKVKN